MALRSLIKLKVNKTSIRGLSTQAKFVSLDVNDKTGIATLNMQRAPVNSLNTELLSQMTAALTEAENNKCKGLILTSKNDGVFSAGLDILEMYKPDQERVKNFWRTLQDAWMKLYGTPYPTVAVINGHSPAGGCLLSLSCEYRVMAKNFTIGLNETQLGIVAPTWFISSMKNVIGHRQSELALTTAETFLKRFARIPPFARSMTKKWLRQKTIDDLANNRDEDLAMFLGVVLRPEIQDMLGAYMQALKKKSSN
ncbi:hypothetical protein JTB14_003720 [Gonioctena quinquepunctata]|nr:hypothetical protein JTB14_003720 [Gonioctena quinquepunctata]